MNEEDLKAVIATYQQKAFELFNANIVYETQINSLQKKFEALATESAQLREALAQAQAQLVVVREESSSTTKKRGSKTQDDF